MDESIAETIREEKELVRRIAAGDDEAFEMFSERYIPGLYRFAAARLAGEGQLARDIVQTTLCKVMAKLGSYRGDGPLFGWLCACCRNEIAMHFRAQGKAVELSLEDDAVPPAALAAPTTDRPDEILVTFERTELVHLTLDLLPPRYAQALEWKYAEGFSMREIARRLQLTEKAVESLLTRARAAFRQRYEALEETGSQRAGLEVLETQS